MKSLKEDMTAHTIYNARFDADDLSDIHHNLIVERMTLDRCLSTFLDAHDLDEMPKDSERWQEYRTHVKRYGELTQLINTATYYQGHHAN